MILSEISPQKYNSNFEILIRKFDISKFVSENLELTEKAFLKRTLEKYDVTCVFERPSILRSASKIKILF